MRNLTHDQYAARLHARHPHLKPLDRYCKANIPLPVLCELCGNTTVREAHQHIRFNCPNCRGKRDATGSAPHKAAHPLTLPP